VTEKSEDWIREIFSESLGDDGVDSSLFTGLDWQHLILYGKVRKELAEKYPKPKALREDEDDIMDDDAAKNDAKASLFRKALVYAEAVYDKTDILQNLCTEHEKQIIRFYTHITRNWSIYNINLWHVLSSKDLYELVESYFKILRKYGVTTTEEPYYFLSPSEKRKIKLEADMLKRSTQYDDSEIKVSLLEELI